VTRLLKKILEDPAASSSESLVLPDKESILLLSGWPFRDEFGVLASVRMRQLSLLKQLSSQLYGILFFDVSVDVNN